MHRPSLRAAALTVLSLLALPQAVLAQTPADAANALGSFTSAAPGWLAAMLLMMGVTTGLLALLHRHERHVLFLAGMMFGWVLLQLAPARPDLLLIVKGLLVMCAVQYLLRSAAWTRLWLDIGLLVQCLLLPLSLPIQVPSPWLTPAVLCNGLLVAELLAAFGWHLRLRWLALHEVMPADPVEAGDFRVMSLLLGLAAPALIVEQLIPLAGPNAPASWLPWLALALPLLMLALGLFTIVAFARSAAEAETHRALIEQRMHERVADAERNFHAMAELKLEQVTERERKRIAADLHDDLGAKLLTIVHTSESDRISTLAREALEEMRLSVRGLTGKPVQLLDALGDWRAELVARLGQANIQAEWKSPAEDIIHTLPARAYVQTTRIFREAVSNIIKHSGATHCTIGCNVQDGDFQVTIQDNGQGIPAELDGRLDRGHGMASMKSRAKQMHGQCLVESGPGWGTVIRLTIPL